MNIPGIAIYQSHKDNLWRWRLWSGNGKIMADSGEGYASKANARRAAIKTSNLMDIARLA